MIDEANRDLCDRPKSHRPSSAQNFVSIDIGKQTHHNQQACQLIRGRCRKCYKDRGFPGVFKRVEKSVPRQLTKNHK